jgi:hyaluronate lyase
VFHGLADPLAIWSEASVTWNSAPAAAAGVASLGPVLAGTWYEIDVTSLTSGDGTISLRVRSPSSNGANFATKERAGFAPSLVVIMR